MLRFSVKIVDIFLSVSFFIWVCEDLAGNQERAAYILAGEGITGSLDWAE